jgi:ABC-2 type transport system ATP-binding protein
MWEVIQSLVAGGTSLLLTTQYLEEADLLADEIVVIDHGKVIAQGTADQLKAQVGGERLAITVSHPGTLALAHELVQPLGVGPATVEEHRRSLLMPVTGGAAVLVDALRRLDAASIALDDVGLRRPTLDDVFLTLTGHAAEDIPEDPDAVPAKEMSR